MSKYYPVGSSVFGTQFQNSTKSLGCIPHRQVQEAQIAVSCALHVIGFLLSAANWTKLWVRCFTQKRTKLEWNSELPTIRTWHTTNVHDTNAVHNTNELNPESSNEKDHHLLTKCLKKLRVCLRFYLVEFGQERVLNHIHKNFTQQHHTCILPSGPPTNSPQVRPEDLTFWEEILPSCSYV